eukprot:5484756-Amphidinium_carterae.1
MPPLSRLGDSWEVPWLQIVLEVAVVDHEGASRGNECTGVFLTCSGYQGGRGEWDESVSLAERVSVRACDPPGPAARPLMQKAHGEGGQIVWNDHDVVVAGAPRRALHQVARASANCHVLRRELCPRCHTRVQMPLPPAEDRGGSRLVATQYLSCTT